MRFSYFRTPAGTQLLFFIQLQHAHECLLRDLYIADLAHTFFTFLLFFQKLSLTGDITAIAFGQYILAHCLDRLSGNYLAADGCLNRDFKQVARDFIFKLLAHLSAPLVSRIRKYDKGQRIHLFTVDQDIQLDKIALLIAKKLIIKGCISTGTGFQGIKEIIDDLI